MNIKDKKSVQHSSGRQPFGVFFTRFASQKKQAQNHRRK